MCPLHDSVFDCDLENEAGLSDLTHGSAHIGAAASAAMRSLPEQPADRYGAIMAADSEPVWEHIDRQHLPLKQMSALDDPDEEVLEHLAEAAEAKSEHRLDLFESVGRYSPSASV